MIKNELRFSTLQSIELAFQYMLIGEHSYTSIGVKEKTLVPNH